MHVGVSNFPSQVVWLTSGICPPPSLCPPLAPGYLIS
nr:MAG TPA: hypothetical protein [Caudoviricetes sp.]